jgi:ubiquinone/menaquinone biosynthesis C-methylase UbiE
MPDEPNYTLGHGDHLVDAFGLRGVGHEAQFVVPYLRSGMSVLDCGCGPGTITAGLAGCVSPGRVVGIDISGRQFDIGRKLALQKGIATIDFREGDVTNLEFEDGSFDVVFAHGVLYHLADPSAALTEMCRVLVEGGLLGIRDADESGSLVGPADELVQRGCSAVVEAWRLNGTDPFFGRRQLGLVRRAGCEPLHFSASYDNYTRGAQTRGLAEFIAELLQQPHMCDPLVESGWTDPEELQRMRDAIVAWGAAEDAFYCRARCETVARKRFSP